MLKKLHQITIYAAIISVLVKHLKGRIEFHLIFGEIPECKFSDPVDNLPFDDSGRFWNSLYMDAPLEGKYSYENGILTVNGISIYVENAVNVYLHLIHLMVTTSSISFNLNDEEYEKAFYSLNNTSMKVALVNNLIHYEIESETPQT